MKEAFLQFNIVTRNAGIYFNKPNLMKYRDPVLNQGRVK
jgi:hypothetical protein